MQAVAPSAAWKVPALHRKQVLVAAEGATLPGAHADGNLAPAAHEWPGGHVRHSSSDVSPLSLLKVPEKQESSTLLPAGQYTPKPHASHAVRPLLRWYVPALHDVHSAAPLELETEPGAHALGADRPPAHQLPVAQSVQSSCEV